MGIIQADRFIRLTSAILQNDWSEEVSYWTPGEHWYHLQRGPVYFTFTSGGYRC